MLLLTKGLRGCCALLLVTTLFPGDGASEAATKPKPKTPAAAASKPTAKPPAKSGSAAKPAPKTPAPSTKPAPKAAAPKPKPTPKAQKAKPAPKARPAPKASAQKPKAAPPKTAKPPATSSKPEETKSVLAVIFRPFDDGRTELSIRAGEVETPYEEFSAFVLPRATLVIEASGGSGLYAASTRTGKLVADPKKPKWRWTAPAAHGGDHSIRIRDRGKPGGDVVTLHVFVMRPYDGGPVIGGFPIGEYAEPLKGDPAYERPKGLVEVTDANSDTPVSPHFKLGQFVSRDVKGTSYVGSRYVVLKPALLLKLELVLEELARRDLPADTLQVMSGYRTPYYNAEIGNETSWSRHLYGDAADVYLDRDDDDEMDDLDGDGESTKADAVALYDLVEQAIDGETTAGPLAGGLSAYTPNQAHGPFLHIDTRGNRARW